MKELILLFLKLGFLAFGGPAAHIAMMERECVEKRQWLSKDDFLNLYGFTNLIPGPNSTEMVLHIGYLRFKAKGMLVAGLAFILPAMFMVIVLSMTLVHFGSLPSVTTILAWMSPVIVALIASVFCKLSKTQLNSLPTWVLFGLSFGLSFTSMNELSILLLSGIVFWLSSLKPKATYSFVPLSLVGLFWIFLKIGSVLYGSGYVLLSFLQHEFVIPGYLSLQSVLDAFTIGQLTPGPVFTTATAIGYFSHGLVGALLATLGIFMPSFIFVYFLHPLFPKMNQNPHLKSFLEGVKIASLALMLNVVWTVALTLSLEKWVLMGFALVILIKTKLNPSWLIIGSGVLGLILSFLA